MFMSHPEETTTTAAEPGFVNPAGHSRNRNISLTHRRHCHYTHRHGTAQRQQEWQYSVGGECLLPGLVIPTHTLELGMLEKTQE